MNPEFLRSEAGLSPGATVETVSVEQFFRVTISDESWRDAVRYRKLVEILKGSHEGTKVYRLGSINIPVYIVGRSGSGNWLGVSTRVVET